MKLVELNLHGVTSIQVKTKEGSSHKWTELKFLDRQRKSLLEVTAWTEDGKDAVTIGVEDATA